MREGDRPVGHQPRLSEVERLQGAPVAPPEDRPQQAASKRLLERSSDATPAHHGARDRASTPIAVIVCPGRLSDRSAPRLADAARARAAPSPARVCPRSRCSTACRCAHAATTATPASPRPLLRSTRPTQRRRARWREEGREAGFVKLVVGHVERRQAPPGGERREGVAAQRRLGQGQRHERRKTPRPRQRRRGLRVERAPRGLQRGETRPRRLGQRGHGLVGEPGQPQRLQALERHAPREPTQRRRIERHLGQVEHAQATVRHRRAQRRERVVLHRRAGARGQPEPGHPRQRRMPKQRELRRNGGGVRPQGPGRTRRSPRLGLPPREPRGPMRRQPQWLPPPRGRHLRQRLVRDPVVRPAVEQGHERVLRPQRVGRREHPRQGRRQRCPLHPAQCGDRPEVASTGEAGVGWEGEGGKRDAEGRCPPARRSRP